MCWQALERMISDVEANQSQVLDGVSGTVTHACIYACMHVIFTFVLKAWHRDQHIFSMYLKNTTNIQSITELTNPFQLHTLPVQAESLAKLKALRQSATKLQVEKLVRITCMPNDYIYQFYH